MRGRRLCGVLTAALLVAACSSDTGSKSADTDAPTASTVPLTATGEFGQALSARLGSNGTVDTALALDLYASVYGHAQELGATPLVGENVEGTQALNAVLAHWADLTAAQQAIITADLSVAPERTIVVHPDAARGGASRMPQRYDDPAADLVSRAAADIAIHWSGASPPPINAELMAADLPPTPRGGRVLADARPVTADGEAVEDPTTYAACAVRIYPALLRLPDIDRLATLAHETFHCFQYVGHTLGTLNELGQWVTEGQAEWVGATVAGGGIVATEWWQLWLQEAQSLWDRTYDALGFYASLARRGDDVWGTFRRMLDTSPGFTDMYSAAVGPRGTAFMGDVSIDHASLLSVGLPWLPQGPGAAALEEGVAYPVFANEQRMDAASVMPYDATRFSYSVVDPVVAVSSDTAPWAVGGLGAAQVHRSADHVVLCLQVECVCPDGLRLDALALGSTHSVAAAVANVDATEHVVNLTIRGYSLEDACVRFPHFDTLPDTCMVGRWRLTGQDVGAAFVPGLALIDARGGIGGRELTITADGQYTQTDDGSDPVTGHATVSGLNVDVVVVLTGQVAGTVTMTPGHVTFASTSAALHLHAEEVIAGGPPVVIDQDLTDSSMFGNGDASVTCSGSTMVFAFANATFSYATA